MPYIKQDLREELKELTDIIDEIAIDNAGELNYVITKLLIKYEKHKGRSYQTYNDAVGALVCCKDEFERRKVAPYEDSKIIENGDVY